MSTGSVRSKPFRDARRACIAAVVALAVLVRPAAAQPRDVSATLRYGSGLVDIPVGTVLPHLTVTASYSGFRLPWHRTGGSARAGGDRHGRDRGGRWLSDGSVAIGLFDRLEAGATLQHLGDARDGGRIVGGFGRLSLLPGSLDRLHLAVGARFVTSPSFGGDDRGRPQPNRLGYPDARVVRNPPGAREFRGNLSPYVVATAVLPGLDGVPLAYDMTLSAGWGGGIFSAGGDLDFYNDGSSGGLFAGSAIRVSLGAAAGMSMMAEFNGFDTNAGVRFDFGGAQFGAFALGMNHDGSTAFRSRKFGVAGSIAVCADALGLCRRRSHAPADTITLPAPPPDTVIVVRAIESSRPAGTPATLCLATGEGAQVFLTEAGDTLVGPDRVSLRELGPAVVLAGSYAEGRDWFGRGEAINFSGRSYRQRDAPGPADCGDIVHVGWRGGVPLFAERSAELPYDLLYVPVRPGLWVRYANGSR